MVAGNMFSGRFHNLVSPLLKTIILQISRVRCLITVSAKADRNGREASKTAVGLLHIGRKNSKTYSIIFSLPNAE